MKKLLLITGDIATGKSTFANILSKRYHTNMFFKDSIKEVFPIERKIKSCHLLPWN